MVAGFRIPSVEHIGVGEAGCRALPVGIPLSPPLSFFPFLSPFLSKFGLSIAIRSTVIWRVALAVASHRSAGNAPILGPLLYFSPFSFFLFPFFSLRREGMIAGIAHTLVKSRGQDRRPAAEGRIVAFPLLSPSFSPPFFSLPFSLFPRENAEGYSNLS